MKKTAHAVPALAGALFSSAAVQRVRCDDPLHATGDFLLPGINLPIVWIINSSRIPILSRPMPFGDNRAGYVRLNDIIQRLKHKRCRPMCKREH